MATPDRDIDLELDDAEFDVVDRALIEFRKAYRMNDELLRKADRITIRLTKARNDRDAFVRRRNAEAQRLIRAHAAWEKAQAEKRASHKLTPRQAECLLAVKLGHSWSVRRVGTLGDGTPRWRSTRSMGGAVWRMRQTLESLGLVTDWGQALTPAGVNALDAYIFHHPKFFRPDFTLRD